MQRFSQNQTQRTRQGFKQVLASVLGLLSLSTVISSADTLVLVEEGLSRAPIVIFENAPPKTRRAADELAEYIEKVSGARPEVIEGAPDPLPERAIWVGYQPVLDRLFPDLDFNLQQPEGILISASDNHLVIAGRDRWDPEHWVVQGRNWEVVGVQREYGTVNAVYTFLQDYLDVRWIMPGAFGIDIQPRETLAFTPFVYRYHPQFRMRSNLFRLSELGDSRGMSHAWTRFQRLQLDRDHPDAFRHQPYRLQQLHPDTYR